MNQIKVELGERSYPIFIGTGILPKLKEMLDSIGLGRSVAVITNTTVDKLYGSQLRAILQLSAEGERFIVIPDGERFKVLKTVEGIYTRLLEVGCERNTTILAFGGGVVGDIAGFAAATFLRGVPYVQVPTTLLAQVDSSVGGKVGVNHPKGKNLIGAFYQPRLVCIDVSVLQTLPERELMAGLAEVVKYGVIWDADFFNFLAENFRKLVGLEFAMMEKVVQRCCEIKSEVVAQDEREKNLRMILNFGHTVGHALEAVTGYKRFRHGEAVALGMRSEAKMALARGFLSRAEFEKLENLLNQIKIKATLQGIETDALHSAMKLDKKVRDGKLRIVLPKKLGQVVICDDVEKPIIMAGLRYLVGDTRS